MLQDWPQISLYWKLLLGPNYSSPSGIRFLCVLADITTTSIAIMGSIVNRMLDRLNASDLVQLTLKKKIQRLNIQVVETQLILKQKIGICNVQRGIPIPQTR